MAENPGNQAVPFLSITAGAAPRHFILRNDEVLLGRGQECDVVVAHPEVSRKHCILRLVRGTCQIEDLKSRWGTKVDGKLLEGPAELSPGSEIALGPVVLKFQRGAPPDDFQTHHARPDAPEIIMQGKPVEYIPLSAERITFGRGEENDAVLLDPTVSRQHMAIRKTSDGFVVEDLKSRIGSFANGLRFEEHLLVIGDQLQMGPFYLRFDGRNLLRVAGARGARLGAEKLNVDINNTHILNDVTFIIEPGQFINILGPSGAGKSTLLDALNGLRPASSGKVVLDEYDLYHNFEGLRPRIGYVPQDDIVHPELTVRDALRFSARLRLGSETPEKEILKLVERTMEQLGLEKRADTRVGNLSGGQRKRVSVGVELLGRPRIMFLDEPTSGLDPATEFKMMQLLRRMADNGCTVVCTTHVMENVYLADQLLILVQGRLVYTGPPDEARNHFGVQRMTLLYDRIEERPAEEWQEIFEKIRAGSPPKRPQVSQNPLVPSKSSGSRIPLLLTRQWRILKSDPRNFWILLVQPFIIGALVSWVTDSTSLALFFAYVSTLWFGTSNGAQEIVREIPIFRRERFVGMGLHEYLIGKALLLGGMTCLQALILYLTMSLGEWGLAGNPAWQISVLLLTATSAVGVGLALSSLVRSTMQAVMLVPLLLIPQILFSGQVVPASEMNKPVRIFSGLLPSYSAQRVMDVSLLWNKRVARETLKDNWSAFRNVNETGDIKTGEVYNRPWPALWAMIKLICWFITGYIAAAICLKKKERGQGN